jgi:hypothetical protein
MRLPLLTLLLASAIFANAQKKSAAPATDSEIASMIKEISADSIKSYIQKMVSFGTRHSLSDTLSATTGIGAARRWVASKFLQFRRQTGANMTVELDPAEVLPGGRNTRIPRRVIMKNVLGTLKGSDPNDDRVLLISGHLDSRATDVMDSVITARAQTTTHPGLP